jgi:hypothetical protein
LAGDGGIKKKDLKGKKWQGAKKPQNEWVKSPPNSCGAKGHQKRPRVPLPLR